MLVLVALQTPTPDGAGAVLGAAVDRPMGVGRGQGVAALVRLLGGTHGVLHVTDYGDLKVRTTISRRKSSGPGMTSINARYNHIN